MLARSLSQRHTVDRIAMAAGSRQQQQQKKERKKWRKEEIDESVRELIQTNPSLAALILVCLLFVSWWVAEFVSPAVRFGWLVIAPHLWRAAVAWLTQPVLFLLLNLVVFCIWISSSRTTAAAAAAAAAACGNQEHLKSAASSSLPSSSSGQACLAETKKKKKRNSISPDAESLSAEFDCGNPESSALEPPSKENNIKAFLEQKTPPGTSYSNQERSEEFESVDGGHKQNNPNSLFSSASDYADSSSRVLLREDVSVNSESGEASAENGMRDPLVIQKDELNERIEALYAKSREQRRQDSLQRN